MLYLNIKKYVTSRGQIDNFSDKCTYMMVEKYARNMTGVPNIDNVPLTTLWYPHRSKIPLEPFNYYNTS